MKEREEKEREEQKREEKRRKLRETVKKLGLEGWWSGRGRWKDGLSKEREEEE